MSDSSKSEEVDTITGMTPTDKYNAVHAWKTVRQNQKFHGIHFYQRLMTKHPEHQALFSFFKDKQMDQLIRDRDPRLVRQALRIMMALDSIFMNLDRADKVIDLCYQVGYRHHAYGLNPDDFLASRPVLLSSLQTDLGTSVIDKRAVDGISKVFDFFVPHSVRGMEDAAAGRPLQSKSEQGSLVHTSLLDKTDPEQVDLFELR